MDREFESALYVLPDRIRKILINVDENTKRKTQEIRIRADKPLMLTVSGIPYYITSNSEISKTRPSFPLLCTAEEVAFIFKELCASSVYAHIEEMKQGFISMKSGHRAGVCGTVAENGIYREISSVNIRIAREIKGCASDLAKLYTGGGLIIAGPPGTGKTTMLRDFIREMSARSLRIAVIDTRGEISGVSYGRTLFDLGDNVDVTVGIPKPQGIDAAVRTLYPHIVAFDEIGTKEEAKAVADALNCGVYAVTTAHIRDPEELGLRPQTGVLIKNRIISSVALMSVSHLGSFKYYDAAAVENYGGT